MKVTHNTSVKLAELTWNSTAKRKIFFSAFLGGINQNQTNVAASW